MRIEAWGHTDIGLRRETNQDSFLIDHDLSLYIVADGMGGHKGGEVASSIAVQTVREIVSYSYENEAGVNPRDLLSRAYKEANKRIYLAAQEKMELKGMGTTMVCALFRSDSVFVANVGDSRSYLVRENKIWQITEDHSLINDQLRAGLLSEKDLETYGSKNIITRSVGFEADVQCDVIERKAHPGEMIILCSDGLSGLVLDNRIGEVASSMSVESGVTALIQEAKNNGGDDNVSVIMLRVIN